MAKTRTTLTIESSLWTAVRVRAAREGKRDSEVVEAAVRRELGFDLLDKIWEENDLPEDQAMKLSIEAQEANKAK